MINFFIITFLILPWIIVPIRGISDPFRMPQAAFLDFIFMGMICYSFYNGLRFHYRNKWLSFFAIWALFTVFINWHIPFILVFNNNQLLNFGTFSPSIHFILGLFASFIALSFFDKEDYIKIAKAICVSSVLLTLFGIMQVTGFDPFGSMLKGYNHPNHFSACLDNPNIMGNYLALSLPFFFFFKDKKYVLGGLLVLVGVILSKSTLAIISSCLGFFLYVLLTQRKKRILIALATILVLFLIFCFVNQIGFLKIANGFDGRIETWNKTLKYVNTNPLFGQGWGRYKTLNIELQGGILSRLAHNDWLERLLEIGFLGTTLLVLVIINSLRRFNYNKDNLLGISYLTSFVVFLMLMCGSFPLEIAPTALLGLITFWGIEKL